TGMRRAWPELARPRLNGRTRFDLPDSVDACSMEVLPIRQLARWAAAIGGALSAAAVALLFLGPALGLPGWYTAPPGRDGAPMQLPASPTPLRAAPGRPAAALGATGLGTLPAALAPAAAVALPVRAAAPVTRAPVVGALAPVRRTPAAVAPT